MSTERQEKRMDKFDERLNQVEDELIRHGEAIKGLNSKFDALSNNVTQEARETRQVMREQNDKLIGILQVREAQDHDIKKTKIIGRKELWVAILGGGGTIGAVIGLVVTLLGG